MYFGAHLLPMNKASLQWTIVHTRAFLNQAFADGVLGVSGPLL